MKNTTNYIYLSFNSAMNKTKYIGMNVKPTLMLLFNKDEQYYNFMNVRRITNIKNDNINNMYGTFFNFCKKNINNNISQKKYMKYKLKYLKLKKMKKI
jgi:hypothetical protein